MHAPHTPQQPAGPYGPLEVLDTIRNPTIRWLRWLVASGIAVAGSLCAANGINSSPCDPGSDCVRGSGLVLLFLALGSPFYLGFLLAGWASFRGRVLITPAGLHVKVFRTVTYPWQDILDMRTMSTGHYAAGWVRTSTTRELEIYLAGKDAWVRLPLPNASWTGKESYESAVGRIHRAWRHFTAGSQPPALQ